MEKKKIYIIQDSEAGNVIDVFDTMQAAMSCMAMYEQLDKAAGCYTNDFYEIKPDIKVINDKRVDNVHYNRKTETLRYTFNGEQYNVTGEFYIDNDDVLHHTHYTQDEQEIEIGIKLD